MYVKIKLIFSKGSMVVVRVFSELRLLTLRILFLVNLRIIEVGLISRVLLSRMVLTMKIMTGIGLKVLLSFL